MNIRQQSGYLQRPRQSSVRFPSLWLPKVSFPEYHEYSQWEPSDDLVTPWYIRLDHKGEHTIFWVSDFSASWTFVMTSAVFANCCFKARFSPWIWSLLFMVEKYFCSAFAFSACNRASLSSYSTKSIIFFWLCLCALLNADSRAGSSSLSILFCYTNQPWHLRGTNLFQNTDPPQ